MAESTDPNVTSDPDPNLNGGETKTFTQDDVNRIVGHRLEREKSKWETEFNAKLQEAMKSLEDEKLQATIKLTELEALLNQERLQNKIAVGLLSKGLKPNRLDAALKLIQVPDKESELDGVLAQFLDSMPEWIGTETGTRPSDNGGTYTKLRPEVELNDEIIANMSSEELKRRMSEVQTYYANRRKA